MNPRAVVAWTLYDFANSAFAAVVFATIYAAYYAGFRGLTTALVDSLPEPGGQVTAMYPEKAIFDVAGFPSVKGRELVEGLAAVPVSELVSASPRTRPMLGGA